MATSGTVLSTAEPGPVVPARAGFWRAPFAARTWAETAHLALNLVVGILGFVFAVVGLALGVGLTPLFLVGLPVLAMVLVGCRGAGVAERSRALALLHERVRAPGRRLPSGAGLWPALSSRLRDGAGWRAWLYLVLMLPWGIVTFTVVTVLWAAPLTMITYPATQPLFRSAHQPGAQLSGDGPRQPGHDVYVAGPLWVSVTVLLGVVLLFVVPQVVRALAAVDRVMVRGLLGVAFLSEQVRDLTESRGAAVDTAEADLRRIERDLHDGAQARLVALSMDLGMAKERLAAGPDGDSARMVASAHDEVKLALQELRDLARGIHPAVLTDRGLDAALSAVAARCTVPVEVGVDLPRRPSPPVETAAYFCVSELLTNVAKHARATRAWVQVSASAERMSVVVGDDGRGGARVGGGSGLAGLAERLRALDGRLDLDSPLDGGTTVTVTLPL